MTSAGRRRILGRFRPRRRAGLTLASVEALVFVVRDQLSDARLLTEERAAAARSDMLLMRRFRPPDGEAAGPPSERPVEPATP